MGEVVAVKLSAPLRSALTRAADADVTTPTAFVRQCVAKELRRRGLLDQQGATHA